MQVRQNFDELVNSALVSPEGIAERKAGIQAELQKQYLDEADDLAAKGEGEEAHKLRQNAKKYRGEILAIPHAATISEELIKAINKSRTNKELWKIQGQELSTTDTALGKILTKEGRDKFLYKLYEGGRTNIFDYADKLIEIMMNYRSRFGNFFKLLVLKQNESNLDSTSSEDDVSIDLTTKDGVTIKSLHDKEKGHRINSLTIDGEEISTYEFKRADGTSPDNDKPSQSVTVGPNPWSDENDKQIFLIDSPAGPRYSAILGSRDNTRNEWSMFPVPHDLYFGIQTAGQET